MNLANALKLRAALQACPPEQFDYRTVDPECGCVISLAERCGLSSDFAGHLDVTFGEDFYLCGIRSQDVGDGKHCSLMSTAEATGEAGIREALRRLDLILARHGYQPDGTPREAK